MQKITTFLSFKDNAEEAARFYTSVFRDAKIEAINHYTEAGPLPAGTVMVVTFSIKGQLFAALNGGPDPKFTMAISLVINCDTQEEVDHYWDKLSQGGQKSQCGWLMDKFGLWWQVTPTVLTQYISDPDASKVQRVMEAMMKMGKIDIAAIEKAYNG